MFKIKNAFFAKQHESFFLDWLYCSPCVAPLFFNVMLQIFYNKNPQKSAENWLQEMDLFRFASLAADFCLWQTGAFQSPNPCAEPPLFGGSNLKTN